MILLMDKDELLNRCYEWQVGNLSDELYKTGMGYIWLEVGGIWKLYANLSYM
jgi:hypothetical protein